MIADDNYLRESIYDPNAKVVYGFHANIMPNFSGSFNRNRSRTLLLLSKR